MLFNSIPFLFVFLPITLFVFFVIGRSHRLIAAFWLATASVIYYGYWNYSFVALLLSSIVFNYAVGYLLNKSIPDDNVKKKIFLVGAIGINLVLLGYYKYAGFLIEIADDLFAAANGIGSIILPLGISFFTFTQIAYLVDAYQGKAKEYNFVHYLLFVTYFPHLIAGPILHHGQMMPQFAEEKNYRINWTNIAVGMTIFTIGLAKKVLLADNFSRIAGPIFSATQSGSTPPFSEAWFGALGYTFQLYFDFSGYSDMAVGLSLLFNIKLPINFNSPYKSASIIEFWRRWHISLSTFLRNYLYIQLGGSRKGKVRKYINLMATMLLCGLWHGAGWTFVVWGGLHGLYVVINHGFRALRAKVGLKPGIFGLLGRLMAVGITFFAVVIGWVVFRANSFTSADIMLHGMFGSYGMRGANSLMPISGLPTKQTLIMLFIGGAISWLLPNTQQWLRVYKPVYQDIETPVWGGGNACMVG